MKAAQATDCIWGARALAVCLAAGLVLAQAPAMAHSGIDGVALTKLSIEELMDIEVTSVSKRPQKLSHSAAAVTVLTGEEIRRSGLTSIPEALRMIPGLHVASIDGNKWAITARGFNNEFANKLLVLIDGRSVYTPLFSGVYWFEQDLVLEDIDRIEVVRGPGGTLWGANAVNGVINIITKSAADTQGLLVSGGGGSLERGFGQARYGGAIGDAAHFRVYLKYFSRDGFDDAGGSIADDDWDVVRTGLRIDWEASERDALTLQGDFYDGKADQVLLLGLVDQQDLRGGNLLARWSHTRSEDSDLYLQFYYDRAAQDGLVVGEKRDTIDLEFQHRFAPLSRHDVIWGLGYRWTTGKADSSDISISGIQPVMFIPEKRDDDLFSAYVQDQITLVEGRLRLTLGSKFEHNDDTGFEFQPSGRLLFMPHERHSLWAAISRAVRTPSRADRDLEVISPDSPGSFPLLVRLERNDDTVSDDLLAFEIGYRAQPLDRLSVDVAAYYNRYDDLRSVERGAPICLIAGVPVASCPAQARATPLRFANTLDAKGYGVELSATWEVTDFWKLIAGYTMMEIDLKRDGSSTSAGDNEYEVSQTPHHQFQLRSQLDLPWNLEIDAALYYVGRVTEVGRAADSAFDDFARVDLRLGWRPTENLEFSLVGQNLQKRRHTEFGNSLMSVGSAVPRSVYGKITLRY